MTQSDSHPSGASKAGLPRIAYVMLSLWTGGLWTICAVAAPTAFTVLERSAAGSLAGRLFAIAAWGGAGIGALLFAVLRSAPRSYDPSVRKLIVTATLAPVLSEVMLGPWMHAARIQGDMRTFGLLHGLGGALFLVACLCTLALLWRLSPAR